MTKRFIGILCMALAISLVLGASSYAAEKETAGAKAKKAGQKVFNYPANVARESAAAVAETGKKGVGVVAKEIETVGQVVTGDLGKTKELITEPITGTAETGVEAAKGVKDIVEKPIKAAVGEKAGSAKSEKK